MSMDQEITEARRQTAAPEATQGAERTGPAYRVTCPTCGAPPRRSCKGRQQRAHNERGAAARFVRAAAKAVAASIATRGPRPDFGFFGAVIKTARERRGFSAKQFALVIDRTEGEVSSWEPDERGWSRRPVTEQVMLLVVDGLRRAGVARSAEAEAELDAALRRGSARGEQRATAALLKAREESNITLASLFVEHLLAIEPPRYSRGRGKTDRGWVPERNGFLGACVQRARLVAGLTQAQFGAAMDPPARQHHVHGWETSAEGTMGERTFARLAAAVGKTPEDLIAEELIARGQLRRLSKKS